MAKLLLVSAMPIEVEHCTPGDVGGESLLSVVVLAGPAPVQRGEFEDPGLPDCRQKRSGR